MTDYVVTCASCGNEMTITSNTAMSRDAQQQLAVDLGWFRWAGELRCPVERDFQAAQKARFQRFTREGIPTFVCPDCWAVSPNPDDVANSYCFNCHAYRWDRNYLLLEPRCMEPTCPDFGSRDFGEGTCPSEHAVPPARRG